MRPKDLPANHDYCKDCNEIKPIEQFPTSGVYCRKCLGVRQKNSPNYLENGRKNSLKKFGLTIEQYDDINERQKGLCAICQKPETTKGKLRLAVDHDHKTGIVRGLLCNTCNTALGKFYDDVDLLKSAIFYLEKSQVELENKIKKIFKNNLTT